jgi:hypothetical protein
MAGEDGEAPDVEQVADELYGVRPDEFVPARSDHVKRARAAGDRALAADITALRKPSTAAWVVNLLVRRARDQVEGLLDLGESLRTAQAALAGEQLKELGRQRAQVVAAMAREGRRLAREAGHPVSAGIEEEVMETLRAALADPRAAQAVRTGRLTTSLSYSGLGEVDLEGVVALAPRRAARAALRAVTSDDEDAGEPDEAPPRAAPARRAPRRPDGADDAAAREAERRREEERAEAERRRREEERLAQERREARVALTDAERAYDEATAAESLASDALDDARAEQERAQRRVAELEDALRRAQDEAGEATAAVRPRKREHDSARHSLDVARRALDRARAHADRLDA